MMKAMLKQLAAMAVTPPVAEEERLNHQGNGDGNQGCPGAEEYGHDRSPDGMAGRAPRYGDVEQHDHKTESRPQSQKWHLPLLQRAPDDL